MVQLRIQSKYGGWRELARVERDGRISIWLRDLKMCGGGNQYKWFESMLERRVGEGER